MIRTKLKCLCFYLWLFITICYARNFTYAARKHTFYDEGDTIVVEAEPTSDPQRHGRQVDFYQGTWGQTLGEGSACLSSLGLLGSCVSFHNCFPYYKFPQFGYYDSFLGNYDQCTYVSATGQQEFGICCMSASSGSPGVPVDTPQIPQVPQFPQFPLYPQFPIAPPTQQPTSPPVVEAEKPEPPASANITDNQDSKLDWPPPIPTHPTMQTTTLKWPPPIPTHPPNHESPTHPTRPVSPFPSWPPQQPSYPTKPPSSFPVYPGWPPTVPQKPVTSPSWPPTAKPPSSWPPISKPPSWPPTTKPPLWHPTTKPPITVPPSWPPTAPKPPSSGAEGGSGFHAQCGSKNGALDQERIVGGQSASPNEWPWIVVLFNNGRQFCGGSLLDSIHILTAAHCVAHMSSWDVARLKAHLGDHNIKSASEVQHVERAIKRVVRHRGFDSRTLYNDVAILTMDRPIDFSQNISPICLPTGSAAYNGKVATVIGWGSLRENGQQPSILQKVSIPIWTNQDCAVKYGPAAPGGIIETMLCAGQPAKDSCSGDSGGPLMINEGRWIQVGIVSWGIGCGKGQYPGVYSRVTHFLPWIQKNLDGNY